MTNANANLKHIFKKSNSERLMISDFFPVLGFGFVLLGLLLILRAMGLLKRDNPFFKYNFRLGGVLVLVGGIIMAVSLIL